MCYDRAPRSLGSLLKAANPAPEPAPPSMEQAGVSRPARSWNGVAVYAIENKNHRGLSMSPQHGSDYAYRSLPDARSEFGDGGVLVVVRLMKPTRVGYRGGFGKNTKPVAFISSSHDSLTRARVARLARKNGLPIWSQFKAEKFMQRQPIPQSVGV